MTAGAFGAVAVALPSAVKLVAYTGASRWVRRDAALNRAILFAVVRCLLGYALGVVGVAAWARIAQLPATIDQRSFPMLYAALLPARIAAWWIALRVFGVAITARTLAACTALSFAIDAAILLTAAAIGGVYLIGMILLHIGTC